MTQNEIKNVLELHNKWLNSEEGGGADLRGANLHNANLSNIDLSGADLSGQT